MNKDYLIIFFIIFFVFILFLNNCNEHFSNNKIHPMNKYFDSVNVITIPKRKKYMTELMKNLEIDANIIDATLIKNINYNNLIKNKFITQSYYKNKNKGRIACHYSQIKLIKEFLNSKDETIFIFEDDIDKNISNNYKKIISKSMNDIPNDWDIIFFGRCWDDCNKMKKINKHLYKVNNPKCRHAYGLTRKGAKKILKYSVPMIDNGDQMYAKNIKNGNIIAYAIHPNIFSQNRYELGSTIGNDLKKDNNILKILKKIYMIMTFKKDKNDKNIYPPMCS